MLMTTEERYQIRRELGQGGMGVVFLAFDTLLEQQVAIKTVRRSDQPYQTWEALVHWLIREARAAASLRGHPNIIAIYDVIPDPESPSIVMEYVEGQTLADLTQTGQPVELPFGLSVLQQCAAAIDYAGSRDIVHRDVKPSNIMVDQAGVVKLMDFGIAKPIDSSTDLTRGLAVGTIQYMSPEQLQAQRVSSRSDQYSLAVVAYKLFTGRAIFEAETFVSWCSMVLNQNPLPASQQNPALAAGVDAVLARGMAKNPADRYSSCAEFVASLERELLRPTFVEAPKEPAKAPPTPPRVPNWAKLIGLSVLASVVVAAVMKFWPHPGTQPDQNANPHAFSSVPQQGSSEPHPRLPKEISDSSGDMTLVTGGDALLGKDRAVVAIDAFYIDKTEVTNQAYAEFCRVTGHSPPPAAPRQHGNVETRSLEYPVVNISFQDAQEFAKWARKRLPTAAEWEKAARGPQGFMYPWGNDLRLEATNLGRKGQPKRALEAARSHPEGASPYGALNMLGNVWEWVATPAKAPDGKEFSEYVRIFSLSPPLTREEPYFQIRGGSFDLDASASEIPTLLWNDTPVPARAHKPNIGFRCVRSP
jgi:serine/threonine-protein kinase